MDDCRSQSPLSAWEQDAAPADDQLLRRFVESRDEQAFRQLVGRHAALVLGVCRRVLINHHDAEEAFQATFLVLAQKAGQVRIKRTLAPWLYGVAHRIAIRAAQKRQRRREEPHAGEIMVGRSVLEEVAEHYDRQVLDQELSALPERLREPLVLHYLLGWTNKQVAEQLQLTVRTVEGRQRRGKTWLRRRLALRKVSLPSALAALAVSKQAVQAAGLATMAETTAMAALGATAGLAGANLSTNFSINTFQLGQTEALAMSSMFTPSAMIVGAALGMGSALAVFQLPAATPRGGQMAMLMLQSVAAQAAPETEATEAADASPFRVAANNNTRPDDPFAEANPFGDAEPKQSGGGPFGNEAVAADPFGDPAPSADVAARGSTSNTVEPAARRSEPEDPSSNQPSDGLPAVVDLSDISDNEREIRGALGAKLRTPIDAVQTPLTEIVDQIRVEFDIPILIDRAALDAALISPDAEITLSLRNVSLTSALNLVLNQVPDLTYVIENEVLWITTADEAETKLSLRVYDVSGLAFPAEQVAERLVDLVEYDAWKINDTGQGEIAVFGDNGLAITQTFHVHEEIVDFLEQLKRLSERPEQPNQKTRRNVQALEPRAHPNGEPNYGDGGGGFAG